MALKYFEMLLTNKSLSQTEKLARILAKCSDEDLTKCINGEMTANMLYNKCTKRDYIISENPTTDVAVLKERIRSIKDDSDVELTADMIMSMVYRTAIDYADNIPMYLDMLKQTECVDKVQVFRQITCIEKVFSDIITSLKDVI